MKPFTEKAIQIIKSIPEGRVMTYGQIAFAAGSPRGARQVVRVLHTMSRKYSLPWHRVISSKGELSIKDQDVLEQQKKALSIEGVEIETGNKISLQKFQHHIHEEM
ncbi:MGMT family protein [Metabacillus sp. KIGAM252]|uniref:MGMT family protein n=1 Tax=Metabacillus flavus TaxID=2823519 RepID=A0ABS5LHH5_9BACI|nr:MGMT family protein [Metabacillus flavus]MBS2970196.1 MGMT family protein [Metabacillus flavus]